MRLCTLGRLEKTGGNCCDWCRKVVGTYSYPDVPKDVYRRHRYCRCMVEFLPGTGKKQDVWSKEWKDLQESDIIEEEINYKVADKKVEESLQNQSNLVYKSLDKSQREALKEYTTGGYLDINYDLARGIDNAYSNRIDEAMEFYDLQEDLVVFRGTNEKYYLGKFVGDEIDSKVFYSTSLD